MADYNSALVDIGDLCGVNDNGSCCPECLRTYCGGGSGEDCWVHMEAAEYAIFSPSGEMLDYKLETSRRVSDARTARRCKLRTANLLIKDLQLLSSRRWNKLAGEWMRGQRTTRAMHGRRCRSCDAPCPPVLQPAPISHHWEVLLAEDTSIVQPLCLGDMGVSMTKKETNGTRTSCAAVRSFERMVRLRYSVAWQGYQNMLHRAENYYREPHLNRGMKITLSFEQWLQNNGYSLKTHAASTWLFWLRLQDHLLPLDVARLILHYLGHGYEVRLLRRPGEIFWMPQTERVLCRWALKGGWRW